MDTPQDASEQRDRSTRISRRVRAGVIGFALLGSLGTAGYLASNAAHNASAVTAAGSPQAVGPVSRDDDEYAMATSSQGPLTLQPGTLGSTHATTGGSAHVSSPSQGQVGPATTQGSVGLQSGSALSHASTAGS